MPWILLLNFTCFFGTVWAQSTSNAFDWESRLQEEWQEFSKDDSIFQNPKYRFQFAYTPIVQDSVLTTLSFGEPLYFYPASLVKVPVALIALEFLDSLGIPLDAIPVFQLDKPCGSSKFVELSQLKTISFEQIFRELLTVSDNNYYNMLYKLLGPEKINQRLETLGFTGTHIYRAFTGCSPEYQFFTNPWQIIDSSNHVLASRESHYGKPDILLRYYSLTPDRWFGSFHEDERGHIVPGFFDLNFNLELPVSEIHEMMLRFYYPQQFPENERWKISEKSRKLVQRAMLETPSQIQSAYQDLTAFSDTIYKYANLQDSLGNRTPTWSKLGLSYGFASETALLQIPNTDQYFMLTASIYVNENDTVNDGIYEYETTARTAFETVARFLADFQLKNVKF